jgi:energy-coupling factor transporter ATP-binding protein EcfA2
VPTETGYAELASQLNSLRKRTARFRRVALHVHSPDSRDWPKKASDETRNHKKRFEGDDGHIAFAAELKQHFDLVAITDHMRCGFASRLSNALSKIDGLMVLPGLEVNFRPEAALSCCRIHLLTILPEGSSNEAFARLFAGCPNIPDDAARTGQEEVAGIPLRQWISIVRREGGICIAAHVDNDQGIRCNFRQTARDVLKLFSDGDGAQLERENHIGDSLKQYLLNSGIHAVEVARASDTAHYRWAYGPEGRTASIPTVLTFDAHCVEDFNRPYRVTYFKMTQLNLQGLKDAFAFPETRIRFPQHLPPSPSPCISGIQILGGPKSFFQNETIAFTENLNCLIGPRGSGKSTIVEALRYVFGYNRKLSEFDKLEVPIRELQRANLIDCLIRIVYRVGNDERILEATFDPKADYVTKVYTAQGEFLEVADVETTADFPLRLFGWSEIETIGRDPARQRDMLDRLIQDIAPVLRRRLELRRQLRDSRAAVLLAVRAIKSAFEKSDGEIRRYKEYSADFDKLNTPEVQGLFAALDLANAKHKVLAKVKENVEQLSRKFGDPAMLLLRGGLDTILDASGQELRDWWLGHELSLLNLLSAEQDVQNSVRLAIERLRSFSELVDQHIALLTEHERDIEQRLRSEFSADAAKQKVADLRGNAKRRCQHVTALRDGYRNAWDELQRVLAAREAILDELVQVQNQVAGLRAQHNQEVVQTLNDILPSTMRVSIEFVAGGDTDKFGSAVAPFLAKAPRYKARNLAAVVAKFYCPPKFAKTLLSGNMEDLRGKSARLESGTSEFGDDDVKRIAEATNPYGFDDHADVATLAEDGKRLEQILELQEVEWDDRETILLDGRPVNEMSPGQRSSAMLPLIALAETTPLVIDQPEDNLDKRLIGGVLASVLAQLKEKRQIIVCTHDPNIVVGGDAEQVVVLDALSDRKGRVGNHGSIDNPDIVQTIIELLEGGKQAFESRQKRYGERAAASRDVHPDGVVQ